MLSLSFAKLVATPTNTSWSQAYNAGNLFAVLSLSSDGTEENVSLNAIGKDMFSSFESEFFTLEEKSLQTIKEAIANSTHTIPSSVTANLCVAYFKDNILYVFIYGKGSILMKRDGKIGPLLENTTDEGKIIAASGYLNNNDTVIIQSHQFTKDMPADLSATVLELTLPNDIAEALSPAMHEKNDGSPRGEAGAQAAIIINYKDALKQTTDETMLVPDLEAEETPPAPQATDEPKHEVLQNPPPPTLSHVTAEERREHNPLDGVKINDANPAHHTQTFSMPKVKIPPFLSLFSKRLASNKALRLNHRTKLFLTIAVIIAGILVMSILLTKQREADAQTAALFQSVYGPALDNYEGGLDVESINKLLARDQFLKSQKILQDGIGKFKKGSNEEKQLTDLLAKVEKELGGSGGGNAVQPKQVDVGTNDLVSIANKTSAAKGFVKDGDAVYYVTANAVVSVDSRGTKKGIIKNNNDWSGGLGIATYQGNIYVLDAENAVLKFTPAASGFGKSNYFRSPVPDMSNAAAIAIDGSVWILFKDGAVAKYTRGVTDNIKVTGLDKPMRSPTKIVTNTDMDGVYVLDPVNSRIVELSKDGNFQTAYTADVLKNAKEMEVSETDGKITVLSGGKFWEILL